MGKTIGFVGGGRVASIILGGWSRAGITPDKVLVYDVNADVVSRLVARHPQIEASVDIASAATQDIVFLAVHPPIVTDVLQELTPNLQSNAVLVSLTPKFTISKLSQMLGGFSRIARMIPNAPSIVGRGYNPIVFGPEVAGEKNALRKILEPLGDCPEVAEEHLEIFAVVSAMALTWLWPQFYQLSDLAQANGIPSDAALVALDGMLSGAVAVMRESGLPSEQVQDLIPIKPVVAEVEAFMSAAAPKVSGLMNKLRP